MSGLFAHKMEDITETAPTRYESQDGLLSKRQLETEVPSKTEEDSYLSGYIPYQTRLRDGDQNMPPLTRKQSLLASLPYSISNKKFSSRQSSLDVVRYPTSSPDFTMKSTRVTNQFQRRLSVSNVQHAKQAYIE